jgi:hypothetical protein
MFPVESSILGSTILRLNNGVGWQIGYHINENNERYIEKFLSIVVGEMI